MGWDLIPPVIYSKLIDIIIHCDISSANKIIKIPIKQSSYKDRKERQVHLRKKI